MNGFLYALLGAALASIGARDQVLAAQLATAQGRRPALLLVALTAAAACSGAAAWLGGRMLADMAPAARGLFAALALLLAGGEMLVFKPGKAPREPTASLFAAALVFAGFQVTDAARFLVLALAVGTAAPVTAGIGGAAGSMAALALAWSAPDLISGSRIRPVRRIFGALMVLVGLALGVPNVIGITA